MPRTGGGGVVGKEKRLMANLRQESSGGGAEEVLEKEGEKGEFPKWQAPRMAKQLYLIASRRGRKEG